MTVSAFCKVNINFLKFLFVFTLHVLLSSLFPRETVYAGNYRHHAAVASKERLFSRSKVGCIIDFTSLFYIEPQTKTKLSVTLNEIDPRLRC